MTEGWEKKRLEYGKDKKKRDGAACAGVPRQVRTKEGKVTAACEIRRKQLARRPASLFSSCARARSSEIALSRDAGESFSSETVQTNGPARRDKRIKNKIINKEINVP